MQAGKEPVPVSYRDGGTRAMVLEHGEITEQIIGAAFEVYSILGYGFLENVLPLDASGSHARWRVSPSVFHPCSICG